tara:strand:- start:371 stop:718 length:348 start_codon:yes stop_codon:yes gene_type:complete
VYVRDLKPGVLIRPVENYEWDLQAISHEVRKSPSHWHGAGKGQAELIESGIQYHATQRFTNPRYGKETNRKIGIYVGVKQLKEYYYGVKKQHMILVDGILCVVDGYSFRDVEKVS